MKKSAFTMIELVFVIVILGILASIAIPKLAATRDDAVISKGKADVASIRSAIVSERQSWLVRGTSNYIKVGNSTEDIGGATRKNIDKDGLFGGVLMYAIADQSGKNSKWSSGATTAGTSQTYKFRVQNTDIVFTYTQADGKFTCNTSATGKAGTLCSKLIN